MGFIVVMKFVLRSLAGEIQLENSEEWKIYNESIIKVVHT